MDKDPNAMLYWGKEGMESSAGRRCALAPRHMLFLYLEYLRHGASQDYVASAHRISQTSACRYFAYVQHALAAMTPTADNLSEMLQKAETEEEVQQVAARALNKLEVAAGVKPGSAGRPGKTLPGNVLSWDGVEVLVERPTDKDERKDCHSGKAKTTTRKSDMAFTRSGLLIGHSGFAPGSTHDLTLLRQSEPDLGLITKCIRGKSDAMKITELADKGFRSLEKHYPEAVVKIPLRRAKSGTKTARAYNHSINSKRVIAENSFRKLKTFARLQNRVRRNKEKLREMINVITGLVNLRIMTSANREPRTHRKGKKPGLKTARNR